MKQRVITAMIAASIVLSLLFVPSPIPVLVMATLCVYFAAEEIWFMVFQSRSLFPLTMASLFAGSATWLSQQTNVKEIAFVLLGLFLLAVGLLLNMLRRSHGHKLLAPAMVWVMAPLIGLLILHLFKGRTFLATPLLLILVPVWAGDTAAILVGRRWGKTPLWPEISPGKTWEGAKASLFGSILAGLLVAPLVGVSWYTGALCGVTVGVLGPYGDLFESYLKRRFGAKDSGGLFPGHGGVLDRIDSILMPALPVVVILLILN